MKFPAPRFRNFALVLASIAVGTYVMLLLGTTWFAQGELRATTLAQARLSLQQQAAALGYFYSERHHDLTDLRKSAALSNFFANRDLGMSMQYGLRASLLRMQDALDQVRNHKHIGSRSVYTDVAVYDDAGDLLAASEQHPGSVSRHWSGQRSGDSVQIRIIGPSGSAEVVMYTGVPYRDRHPATLVAWIDHGLAFKQLVAADPGASTARFVVGWQDQALDLTDLTGRAPDSLVAIAVKALEAKRSRDTTVAALEGDLLAVRALVPDTPFWLLGLYPAWDRLGLLPSHGFFAALVVLAVLVLGTATWLLRTNARNLLLQARIEESRRQEKLLSDHNAQLAEEIARRKGYEKRLIQQASLDALTGLPNRALALDRLSQAIKRCERAGDGHVLVLFADLDRFKQVNDSLGHTAGDRLLVQVAKRLAESIRATDTVARLGGDEFLVICPDVFSLEGAEVLARNLLRQFITPFTLSDRDLFITTSVGLALYPQDGLDPLALMKNADLALYRAKESGRRTFRFFTAAMNDEMQERLLVEERLRRALARGDLRLVYQPIVRLGDGEILGFEALVRWEDPELGNVPPDRFIPLAEDAGLIDELGAWVLESACSDAQGWQALKPVSLAVNISSRQLRQNRDFILSVERTLRRFRLDPSRLELEITETLLLEDLPETNQLLEDLSGLGVRLALDDFGTGYSALSYLKRIPFDVLKIDRSFVQDAVADAATAGLVRAILAMAAALQLEVVGEGVETREQAELLRINHCARAQGYYFSVPVSADQVTAFLSDPQLRLPAGAPARPRPVTESRH